MPKDQYKVFRSLTKYNYASKDSILKHFKVNLNYLKKNKLKWETLLDLIPDSINGKSFNEKFSYLREKKLIVTNLPKKSKTGSTENRGIPQGSAMSAVLSNIYLIDFDSWLYNLSQDTTQDLKFVYRRYCDDLIIICEPKDVEVLNNKVLSKIKEYSLKIQPKKTELIEFQINSKGKIRAFNKKKAIQDKAVINFSNEQKYYKNLQYLGFEFNGESTYIRPGSLSRYFRKMKARIVKTIMMAYSKKSKSMDIKKRQIYEKYSHFGSRNFISYAQNAAKKEYVNSNGDIKQGMDSKSITRQIAAHISIIKKEISKTSIQRFEVKESIRTSKIAEGKKVKHIPLKL